MVFFFFPGRTDMLTLMAMRWNQQKFKNLASSLACRYQKVEMNIVIFFYCKYLLLYIFVGITFFFFRFLFFCLFEGHKTPGKPMSRPGKHENATGSDTG